MLPPLNYSPNQFPGTGWRARMMLLAILVLTVSGLRTGVAQTGTGLIPSRPKRILMLFSESKDVPGNILLEQAVRSELQKLSTNRLEFFSEHLDASHFSDQAHFQFFKDYLGKKYAGQNLDLIMAFPSRDYTLAGALPDALFPDVPVVFIAVNELEVPYEISKLGVTGIVQRFDLRGTLGLMLHLQPDTHRVVVIGGNTEGDRATLGRIGEAARALEGVEFDFWTNRPVAEMPAAVKALPPGTVVLLSTVLRDVTGQTYFLSQLAQLLAPAAAVPVYVLGGWALGSGAVGGSVVDSEDLGARGAQLSLRVLDGVKPETLPIEVATKGTPTLDWRALQRWHISESRLPSIAWSATGRSRCGKNTGKSF